MEGIPDLVVKILSPSTSHNDKIRIKRQYERFGLKEYWIVDPVHLSWTSLFSMQAASCSS
ncbi:Uma2 family endonuclease [Cohnella sp.]|uniref:Uma2 family endonuclease n=1 Tax=Cohnella sp. TaxID=1883426 RepID=UPI003703F75C